MAAKLCQCQRAACAHQKAGPVCTQPIESERAVLLCAGCMNDLWMAMYPQLAKRDA